MESSKGKKVGVITFYRYNYGGFLQAYALQNVLMDLGYDAELIQYDYLHDRTFFSIPFLLIKKPVEFAKKLIIAILHRKQNYAFRLCLENSARKNLKESIQYTSEKKLVKAKISYDILLTGSDQVFNPLLHPQGYKIRMLDFGHMQDIKRSSYAASIGNKGVPPKYEKYFSERLSSFNSISVRENNAVSILEKYTKKEVLQHIDPTFLLDKKDWNLFSQKLPPEVNQPFIFVHILERQPELIQYAQQLSQKMGCKILMSDGRNIFKNVIDLSKPLSPEQFIQAISESEYVVTNSFHGSALSIILHSKVRIFLPNAGTARLKELIEQFNLLMLTQNKILSWDMFNNIYSNVDSKIQIEKQRAIDYLGDLKNI